MQKFYGLYDESSGLTDRLDGGCALPSPAPLTAVSAFRGSPLGGCLRAPFRFEWEYMDANIFEGLGFGYAVGDHLGPTGRGGSAFDAEAGYPCWQPLPMPGMNQIKTSGRRFPEVSMENRRIVFAAEEFNPVKLRFSDPALGFGQRPGEFLVRAFLS